MVRARFFFPACHNSVTGVSAGTIWYHEGLTTKPPQMGGGSVSILELEDLSIFGFRIYLTATAEMSDVRPDEWGELYAERMSRPVDNSRCEREGSTTAYDRADDRAFPEDWDGSLPLRCEDYLEPHPWRNAL